MTVPEMLVSLSMVCGVGTLAAIVGLKIAEGMREDPEAWEPLTVPIRSILDRWRRCLPP